MLTKVTVKLGKQLPKYKDLTPGDVFQWAAASEAVAVKTIDGYIYIKKDLYVGEPAAWKDYRTSPEASVHILTRADFFEE